MLSPDVENILEIQKKRSLREEQLKEKILKSIKAYSVDDEGNPIVCPNCKGEHIEMYTTITNFKSLLSFIIGFVSGTLPFSARYQYKCEDCNTEFPIKN